MQADGPEGDNGGMDNGTHAVPAGVGQTPITGGASVAYIAMHWSGPVTASADDLGATTPLFSMNNEIPRIRCSTVGRFR